MTTLNAKANNAYNELIAEYEREHPDGVWLGFDHQRDAFETGWEAGHKAARPVVDREALQDLLTRHWFEYIGEEEGFDCGCNEHGTLPGMPTVTEAASHLTDAVLALLSGTAKYAQGIHQAVTDDSAVPRCGVRGYNDERCVRPALHDEKHEWAEQ